MENDQIFRYNYSAKQNKEVESIRKKYMPKEVSKTDLLKDLDNRVQTAGLLQGLSIGIIGALIFGIGMCFGLRVFTGPGWLAMILCIAGMCVMAPAYPVSRHIAKKTRAELVPKILQLSEEIIGSEM